MVNLKAMGFFEPENAIILATKLAPYGLVNRAYLKRVTGMCNDKLIRLVNSLTEKGTFTEIPVKDRIILRLTNV